MRFDDLTAFLLKIQLFFNVTLCRWVFSCLSKDRRPFIFRVKKAKEAIL